MTPELCLPGYPPVPVPNGTIYVLQGVWCPGTCGGSELLYVAPSYGASSDYIVFCLHCDWTSND